MNLGKSLLSEYLNIYLLAQLSGNSLLELILQKSKQPINGLPLRQCRLESPV